MAMLHPKMDREFHKGNFIVRKRECKFSAMVIDQAHAQNNATFKGDGGAVGLTKNPPALKHWMLCGPEMARLVTEFENSTASGHKRSQTKHHVHTKTYLTSFVTKVTSLKSVLNEMGNPFCESGKDLIILDTRDIVEDKVKEAVLGLVMLGQHWFDDFVKDRLESNVIGIEESIQRNKMTLLAKVKQKTTS